MNKCFLCLLSLSGFCAGKKEKKRAKIKPVGFIVGTKNIYLTTDNGRLIIIDISTGRSSSMLKIDNEKIKTGGGHTTIPTKNIIHIKKIKI